GGERRSTSVLLRTGIGGVCPPLACAAACIPGGIAAVRERKLQVSWEGWRFRFLLLWLLFPIAFIFLVSQLKPFYLIRYFVFVLPALVLLAASGLGRLRSRWLLGAALVLLGMLSLRGVAGFYQ